MVKPSNEDHMEDDPVHDLIYQEKVQWAKNMRLMFSVPEMLHPDGSINQVYFKPKRLDIFDRSTLLNWGEPQDKCLLKGILQYGINDWSSIIIDYLPNWDARELRQQAIRLIGATSEDDLEATYLEWKEQNKGIDTSVTKAASMRSLSNAGTTRRAEPAPPKQKLPKPPKPAKVSVTKKQKQKTEEELKLIMMKEEKKREKKEKDATFHSKTRTRFVEPSNRTLRTRKRMDTSFNIYDYMDFDD